MPAKKVKSKKATPVVMDAPEVVVEKPKVVVKKTIMDKCPEGRSISDWCAYISNNAHCFSDQEVTEARQHIQATQV